MSDLPPDPLLSAQGLPSITPSRYLPLHHISFCAFLLSKHEPQHHNLFFQLYANLRSHIGLNIDAYINRLQYALHHVSTPNLPQNGPNDVLATFSDIKLHYPSAPVPLCHPSADVIYPFFSNSSAIYLTKDGIEYLSKFASSHSMDSYFILLLSECLSRCGYASLPLYYSPLTALCTCYSCPQISPSPAPHLSSQHPTPCSASTTACPTPLPNATNFSNAQFHAPTPPQNVPQSGRSFKLLAFPEDIKHGLMKAYPMYALQRQNGIVQNLYSLYFQSIFMQSLKEHRFSSFLSHFVPQTKGSDPITLQARFPNLAHLTQPAHNSSYSPKPTIIGPASAGNSLHSQNTNTTTIGAPPSSLTSLHTLPTTSQVTTATQPTLPTLQRTFSSTILPTASLPALHRQSSTLAAQRTSNVFSPNSPQHATDLLSPPQSPHQPDPSTALLLNSIESNTMFIDSTLCWVRGISQHQYQSWFILEKFFFITFLCIATILTPLPDIFAHMLLPSLRYHRSQQKDLKATIRSIQHNLHHFFRSIFYRVPLTSKVLIRLTDWILTTYVVQLIIMHVIHLAVPEIQSVNELCNNSSTTSPDSHLGDSAQNNEKMNKHKNTKEWDDTTVLDMLIQSFYDAVPENHDWYVDIMRIHAKLEKRSLESKSKSNHHHHHHNHTRHHHRHHSRRKSGQFSQTGSDHDREDNDDPVTNHNTAIELLISIRKAVLFYTRYSLSWSYMKIQWVFKKHTYHYRVAQDVIYISKVEKVAPVQSKSSFFTLQSISGVLSKLNWLVHNQSIQSAEQQETALKRDNSKGSRNKQAQTTSQSAPSSQPTPSTPSQLDLVYYSNVPLTSIPTLTPHTTLYTPPTNDLVVFFFLIIAIGVLMGIRGEFAAILITIYDVVTHNISLLTYTLLNVVRTQLQNLINLLVVYKLVLVELFANGGVTYPINMMGSYQLAELFIIKQVTSATWSPLYNYYYLAIVNDALHNGDGNQDGMISPIVQSNFDPNTNEYAHLGQNLIYGTTPSSPFQVHPGEEVSNEYFTELITSPHSQQFTSPSTSKPQPANTNPAKSNNSRIRATHQPRLHYRNNDDFARVSTRLQKTPHTPYTQLTFVDITWDTILTFESPLTRIPALISIFHEKTKFIVNLVLSVLTLITQANKSDQFFVFDFVDYYYNHDLYQSQYRIQIYQAYGNQLQAQSEEMRRELEAIHFAAQQKELKKQRIERLRLAHLQNGTDIGFFDLDVEEDFNQKPLSNNSNNSNNNATQSGDNLNFLSRVLQFYPSEYLPYLFSFDSQSSQSTSTPSTQSTQSAQSTSPQSATSPTKHRSTQPNTIRTGDNQIAFEHDSNTPRFVNLWLWFQKQLFQALVVWSLGLIVFLHNILTYVFLPFIITPLWLGCYLLSNFVTLFLDHLYSLFPALLIDLFRITTSLIIGAVTNILSLLVFSVTLVISHIPTLSHMEALTNHSMKMTDYALRNYHQRLDSTLSNRSPSSQQPLSTHSFLPTITYNQYLQLNSFFNPNYLDTDFSDPLHAIPALIPSQNSFSSTLSPNEYYSDLSPGLGGHSSTFSTDSPQTQKQNHIPSLPQHLIVNPAVNQYREIQTHLQQDWLFSTIKIVLSSSFSAAIYTLRLLWQFLIFINGISLLLLVKTFSAFFLLILNALLAGFTILRFLHTRCLHSPITAFTQGPNAKRPKDDIFMTPDQRLKETSQNTASIYSGDKIYSLNQDKSMLSSTALPQVNLILNSLSAEPIGGKSGSTVYQYEFSSFLNNHHVIELLRNQLIQQEITHSLLNLTVVYLESIKSQEKALQRAQVEVIKQHEREVEREQIAAQHAALTPGSPIPTVPPALNPSNSPLLPEALPMSASNPLAYGNHPPTLSRANSIHNAPLVPFSTRAQGQGAYPHTTQMSPMHLQESTSLSTAQPLQSHHGIINPRDFELSSPFSPTANPHHLDNRDRDTANTGLLTPNPVPNNLSNRTWSSLHPPAQTGYSGQTTGYSAQTAVFFNDSARNPAALIDYLSLVPTDEVDALNINPAAPNLEHLTKHPNSYQLILGKDNLQLHQIRTTAVGLVNEYFDTLYYECNAYQHTIQTRLQHTSLLSSSPIPEQPKSTHRDIGNGADSDLILAEKIQNLNIPLPPFLKLSPFGPYFSCSTQVNAQYVNLTQLIDFKQFMLIQSYLPFFDIYLSLSTLLYFQLISIDFLPETSALESLLLGFQNDFAPQRDQLPQLNDLSRFNHEMQAFQRITKNRNNSNDVHFVDDHATQLSQFGDGSVGTHDQSSHIAPIIGDSAAHLPYAQLGTYSAGQRRLSVEEARVLRPPLSAAIDAGTTRNSFHMQGNGVDFNGDMVTSPHLGAHYNTFDPSAFHPAKGGNIGPGRHYSTENLQCLDVPHTSSLTATSTNPPDSTTATNLTARIDDKKLDKKNKKDEKKAKTGTFSFFSRNRTNSRGADTDAKIAGKGDNKSNERDTKADKTSNGSDLPPPPPSDHFGDPLGVTLGNIPQYSQYPQLQLRIGENSDHSDPNNPAKQTVSPLALVNRDDGSDSRSNCTTFESAQTPCYHNTHFELQQPLLTPLIHQQILLQQHITNFYQRIYKLHHHFLSRLLAIQQSLHYTINDLVVRTFYIKINPDAIYSQCTAMALIPPHITAANSNPTVLQQTKFLPPSSQQLNTFSSGSADQKSTSNQTQPAATSPLQRSTANVNLYSTTPTNSVKGGSYNPTDDDVDGIDDDHDDEDDSGLNIHITGGDEEFISHDEPPRLSQANIPDLSQTVLNGTTTNPTSPTTQNPSQTSFLVDSSNFIDLNEILGEIAAIQNSSYNCVSVTTLPTMSAQIKTLQNSWKQITFSAALPSLISDSDVLQQPPKLGQP